MQKKFVSIGICSIFAVAIKERGLSKCCKRFGSSVWLEYMPVTHGVASSSLVRTAKKEMVCELSKESFFYAT